MTMKSRCALIIALTAGLCSTQAFAQFAKPEQAIKYRKAAMTVMATHFGRLGAMANGRVPFDAKAAADNAAVVETLSRLPWHAFGPETDLGETKAKPAVWKDGAKFKQLADQMVTEGGKLATAARAGNLDSLKAAFGPAAKTCKACHDDFKEE